MEEGITIKKNCINEIDFIKVYKNCRDQDIRYLINHLLDAHFTIIDDLMSRFAIYLSCIVDEEKKNEPYLWCFVADFFSFRKDIYDDYQELQWEYYYSDNKENYWQFVDFTIEDMWKKYTESYNLPSLKEMIETQYVHNILKQHTKNRQSDWSNLPEYNAV